MTPSRSHKTSRYDFGTVRWTSPLSRACPECEAEIGMRCWSLANHVYPRHINTVHKARRSETLGRAKPKKEQES